MRISEIREQGYCAGVGSMKDQVNMVTIAIDGIGELANEFRQ